MPKAEPKGPIQIKIPRSFEDAAERVRKRGGDKSVPQMVARLIMEADAGADPVATYAAGAKIEERGRVAEQRRRAKRKGAK